MIAPKYQKWSEEYKDVVFLKCMGDKTSETNELMKKEGVRSVPAFHFWKEGKKVLTINGAKKDDIEQGIMDYR